MNFLQLCQRLRQEAGIPGTGPAAVSNQTGELKRVVDWVSYAYQDIQNLHNNWEFLRFDFSFPTIASTQEYAPSAVSLDELSAWKRDSVRCYRTSTGVTDETFMTFMDWPSFRDSRLFGANRSVTGKPIEFSIRPSNKAMALFGIPDAVYTMVGEYWKRAQSMSENTDEPLIPSQFHMIIVWRALMEYATYENAPEAYAKGESNYRRMLVKLEGDQLPPMTLGGPLA